MQQVIVDLGVLNILEWEIPIRIFGYGLMLVFGFILGVSIARWRARRAGEDPDVITNSAVVALVAGVLGARLAYVVENWSQFANAPNLLGAMLDITSGGLIYYGGLVLATVSVIAYFRIKRLPIRRYVDFLAVGVMVGLAFGRGGCLLNGCCWGGACSEHWPLATRFPMISKPLITLGGGENPYKNSRGPSPAFHAQLEDARVRLGAELGRQPTGKELAAAMALPTDGPAAPETLFESVGPASDSGARWRLKSPSRFSADEATLVSMSRSLPLRPAQLLGLVNALVIAGVLSIFYRMRRREGEVFAWLLVLYPITRFMLEMIRADNPHDLAKLVLTHNQVTSAGMMVAGLAMLVWLRRLSPAVAATRAGAG
ncbi:MAG: prolipoprotein diacylglyceryl transferase [Planctomycetota bacterium]|jgi:phosphatidylglycerol:prolipoprotein diacylglycerol transferase